MFGFGDDNKEKLEENMEEIKKMVEDGQKVKPQEPEPEQPENFDSNTGNFDNTGQGQAQPASELDSPSSEDNFQTDESAQEVTDENIQNFEDEFEAQKENSAEENSQELDLRDEIREWDDKQETELSQGDVNQSGMSSQSRQGRRESKERTERRTNSGSGTQSSRGRTVTKDQIPEPAKTKEINVPEIDKGPLFIRQKKFERASQLIYEMRYLTEQVESTINTIEDDIQRDRQTEKQVKEIISEFEDGRSETEKIISPAEE